ARCDLFRTSPSLVLPAMAITQSTSSLTPTTSRVWGTFTCMCLKVSMLPPGSQIGIRDISEAYRNVPTHPSQWPGTAVRLPSSLFDLGGREDLRGEDV